MKDVIKNSDKNKIYKKECEIMRIVHICLAASYVEGWGYQENIIPKYHVRFENEVFILTSEYEFNNENKKIKRKNLKYTNSDGINVISLRKSKRYGYYSKFNDFDGVFEELTEIKPDIIFVHGGQFIALKDVIKYCKKNRSVKLYIDQHADYYNTPVHTLKGLIVHRYIIGYWMRRAIRYVSVYWGVTPWRCSYLHEIYKIPKEKIKLLVMGGDDEKIHFKKMPQLRSDIRQELKIDNDDFVIVTGGKIDRTKNIHLLMKAVSEINNKQIKLIVFGQPNDDIREIINAYSENDNIRCLGWIQSDKAYDYFLASDLAVFPGTHSVLWEQACACGIPCAFKSWEGMHHVDVGGNCVFLYEDSSNEIKSMILDVYNNKEKYDEMKKVAVEKGINTFSYRDIAKRAIEL